MEMMTRDWAKANIPGLEKLCKVRPNLSALGDLAACYFTDERPEVAEPLARFVFDRIRHQPGIAVNLAMTLKDLGRHEEAFQVIEHAYYLDPDNFYIKMAYGECLIRQGFWHQGWAVYDNARPTQQAAAQCLNLPNGVREWDGQEVPEKLLVINEGGIGDRLSYPRFLNTLTDRGINWVFYPFSELFGFYERLFPREKLVADGDDITVTHWTTAFALPAKLDISPCQVPPPLPFTARPENICRYRIERTDNLPVIGICYEGAELYQGGRKVRSMTEGQTARLICQTADKVHWVSLMHGKTMAHPVTTLPFFTWDDTAGLIHNLDSVVSVDTSVMHMAGALNKPLAIMLSGNSVWLFGTKSLKFPWYPSAVLYRNSGRGYENAIDKLIADIRSGAWPARQES